MRMLALIPLLALTTLGGCGTYNPGVESVHQPVVSRTDYVYDVYSGGLSSEQRGALDGWFRSMKLSFGDHISVDGGDRATFADVQEVAGRYGLLVNDRTAVTEGQIAPGMARVVVSRMHADVPGCPDWSRPSQPEFMGSTMSNYGCATNRNLAMMVADPQDLIEGRESIGPVDPRTSANAIKTYRGKVPTGNGELKQESSKGGN